MINDAFLQRLQECVDADAAHALLACKETVGFSNQWGRMNACKVWTALLRFRVRDAAHPIEFCEYVSCLARGLETCVTYRGLRRHRGFLNLLSDLPVPTPDPTLILAIVGGCISVYQGSVVLRERVEAQRAQMGHAADALLAHKCNATFVCNCDVTLDLVEGAIFYDVARLRWDRVRKMVRVRPFALHWLEEHAKAQCAPGGAGRAQDLLAFQREFA